MITVRIRVPSGFSGTAVYKPMLRDIALSSELYDTYVPYRKRFESPYGSYIALTGSSSKHIDLNDYLTSDRVGIYYTVDGTYTGYLDNCPHSGSSIRLEVSKAGGYISQMIFTNNESNQVIYRRTAVEGDSTKIGAWKRFNNRDEIPLDIYGFGTATTLDSTANANGLTTPGVYVLNSNSNDSITNFPLKNKAFKLVVEYVNGTTRYRQTFYPLDSTCTYYVRMKTADGENGWGAWYQFSGTAVS